MRTAASTAVLILALVACRTTAGPREEVVGTTCDEEATALFLDEPLAAPTPRRPRFEDRLRPIPPSEFRVHRASPASSLREPLVRTPARTRGPRLRSTFEVTDLVRPVRSFAAPEIGVVPGGGFARDRDEPPESHAVIDAAALEELIRATIAPGTWDEDGNSVTVRGGRLIVSHD